MPTQTQDAAATGAYRAWHDRRRLLLAAAAALIVFLAIGRLWWLPAHAPLNVNEGWNAGQTVRALGAGPLYPEPDALIANNYPPLSFLIVGMLGSVIGDMIIAGRIIAVLSEIACGIAIYAVVGRLVPNTRWPVIASLLFGGFAVTLLRPYLAINDPQWMGHAAMAMALVLIVPHRGDRIPGVGRVILAAALIVVGGLIKHNIVAIPLAITAWLWLADRRSFAIWIGAVATLAGAACAALFAIWGPAVFIDVLAPARNYSLLRMVAKGGPFLLAMLPALIVCRTLISDWRSDSRLALPALLLVISIPIAIVQCAGSGVSINAFFEAIIAVGIAVPVAAARIGVRTYRWCGIAALPILCLVPGAAAATLKELTGRGAAVRQWQPFIAGIAERGGRWHATTRRSATGPGDRARWISLPSTSAWRRARAPPCCRR